MPFRDYDKATPCESSLRWLTLDHPIGIRPGNYHFKVNKILIKMVY
jgi:hypothetical protein